MVSPDAPDARRRGRRGRGARVAERWLRLAASEVNERRMWLTELDAAIGDGDHGINLDRGLAAVLADLDGATGPGAAAEASSRADAADILVAAGRRVLGTVGGASGALYGRGIIRAGEALRAGDAPGASAGGAGAPAAALAAAIEGIAALGHARPGDKTMLDALVPALEALRAVPPGAGLGAALAAAAEAAESGAAATVPMVARRGRASYLGERSAGHLDPGAASSAILVRCLALAMRHGEPPKGR